MVTIKISVLPIISQLINTVVETILLLSESLLFDITIVFNKLASKLKTCKHLFYF